MNTDQPYIKCLSAAEKCEQYLYEVKKRNIQLKILPSENSVIDRLLGRTLEMTPVYEELVKKYTDRQYQLFIDVILSSAASWNPDAVRKYRKDKAELLAVNNLISQLANDLSNALSKRDKLNNSSGFVSDTYCCICDVIEAASRGNGLYFGFLHGHLELLSSQYDLKYWPSLSKIVKVIAVDAEESKVMATNLITDAATTSERNSKSDFLRAFLASIENITFRISSGLPDDVKITDSSLSTIVNCALELDIDEIIDSSYVKGVRQRLRKTHKK